MAGYSKKADDDPSRSIESSPALPIAAMPALPQQCDVLIVGAGPTGLMLANQLARRGIDALIIDRHAGPARETRALGVQARTIEIYAKLGLIERALELGKRATGANMWSGGRRAARMPLGDIGRDLSPYPVPADPRPGRQRAAARRRAAHPRPRRAVEHRTRRPRAEAGPRHRATAPAPTARPARSKRAGSPAATARAAPCASLNGIGFPGAPYEHVFFVADTTMTGPMVAGRAQRLPAGQRLSSVLPDARAGSLAPGRHPAAGTARSRRSDVRASDSDAARAGGRCDSTSRSASWFSTYRIHHRRAERFRERPLLPARRCGAHPQPGRRAGHEHRPAGRLQPRLEARAGRAGGAREALLDSYEVEREPVAERLLATTDRAFSFVVSDNWVSRMLRTRVLARILALAMRFECRAQVRVRPHFADRHPLSGRARCRRPTPGLPDGSPRAGDRFPG